MKTKILLTTIMFVCTSFAAVTNITDNSFHQTITGAIASASANSVLLVSTGTYYEAVRIDGKVLEIDGGYSSDFSVKTATKSKIRNLAGSCVRLDNSATANLRDLELSDGIGELLPSNLAGGGLLVNDGCTATVANCDIHNNTAEFGAGVFARIGAYVFLSNSFVGWNSATTKGGGIRGYSADVKISDGLNTRNSAPYGAGIAIYNGRLIIDDDAIIYSNYAEKKGGGILLQNNSSALISDADFGGEFINANFVTNGNGGGIYAENSSIVLSNHAAFRSSYASGNGGAVFLTNSSMIITDDASIGYSGSGRTNYAGGDGGGVYVVNSSLIVTNAEIFNCYAGENGGGIFLANASSTAANITDSKIYSNFAGDYGGGTCSEGGTLNCKNCLFTGNNSGNRGGGICNLGGANSIVNCTIAGNSATTGAGGVFAFTGSSFINTVIYTNSAPVNPNYQNSGALMRYQNCCISPALSGAPDAGGNVYEDPNFVTPPMDDLQFNLPSPCFNSGTNMTWMSAATDLDGERRIIYGRVDIGCYENPGSVPGASPFHYVSTTGGNAWPYTNWLSAATAIQFAIDAGSADDTIYVSEGIYTASYKRVYNLKTRAKLDKKLTVIATNENPEMTIILGEPDPASNENGTNAVRCAYLISGSKLANFTLSNGFTMTDGAWAYERSGGGAMLSSGGIISNCVITGNSASSGGSGVIALNGGTVADCIVRGNSYGGINFNYGGLARNCLIIENYGWIGGGMNCWYGGVIQNCTIADNTAGLYGGGIACAGDDVFGEVLIQDSIIYHNAPENYTNTDTHVFYEYSCATPAIPVEFDNGGNITNSPMFVTPTADYHLLEDSPCIDSGTNLPWMTGAADLDGNPRIYDGTVDMGCYEFVPEPGAFGAVISYLLLVISICRGKIK